MNFVFWEGEGQLNGLRDQENAFQPGEYVTDYRLALTSSFTTNRIISTLKAGKQLHMSNSDLFLFAKPHKVRKKVENSILHDKGRKKVFFPRVPSLEHKLLVSLASFTISSCTMFFFFFSFFNVVEFLIGNTILHSFTPFSLDR